MTTEQMAVKRPGLTTIGKAVACVAVLLSGAFIVVKSNRAAAAPVIEGGSLPPYECPIQATGNGVAIPDMDPRCL